MNQPTGTPTSKVTAASIGGALATLVVFIAGLFGLDVAPEAAAALATVLAFGAGYIVKESA